MAVRGRDLGEQEVNLSHRLLPPVNTLASLISVFKGSTTELSAMLRMLSDMCFSLLFLVCHPGESRDLCSGPHVASAAAAPHSCVSRSTRNVRSAPTEIPAFAGMTDPPA